MRTIDNIILMYKLILTIHLVSSCDQFIVQIVYHVPAILINSSRMNDNSKVKLY